MIMTQRKPISESHLLIAGTARDVAHCILKEIRHLHECARGFKCTQILVIESDSSDSTIECLEKLQQEIPEFEFVTLGKLSASIPSRTQRLSHCRNQIVNAVRDDPKYQTVDYVMLADLDGVNELLTTEKIAQCWTVPENWDVVCANQLNYYYDIWALRHPHWNPHNYVAQYQNLVSWMGEYQAHQIAIDVKQIKLDPDQRLIPVDSAFGGLAIYKREAYIAGVYGFPEGPVDEVDHAPFHQKLTTQGYKIYINPAFINCKEPRLPPGKRAKKRPVLQSIRSIGDRLFGKDRLNKYLTTLLSM